MALQLVLERAGASGGAEPVAAEKDIGDNVFLTDLEAGYQCYAFFYPGAMPEPELEKSLRNLGEQTGKNLFVNIGRLNDPDYGKVAKLFEIKRNPVIVVTAVAPLAAAEGAQLSTYVRLDSAKLLGSPERTLQCVQEIFNLYLRGDVARAIASARRMERAEVLRVVGEHVWSALTGLWDFVTQSQISVSVFEGRLELKPFGGGDRG